jgi:hypothetical protein
MYIPQLDQERKRILQLIKEHGVCSGRQLLSEAQIKPEELVKVVGDLVKYDLVSASGGIYNPKEIEQAYFNIRPSNASLTELVLRSA